MVFSIFVVTFSQCYRVVELDTSSYGRLPKQVALFIATLRSAFGDFSLMSTNGFDKLLESYDESDDPEDAYYHSTLMVYFTFTIFLFQVLILFMIFMNFIIAVISDSYAKVTEFSIGHNYKQRTTLIHEREVQLQPYQLRN